MFRNFEGFVTSSSFLNPASASLKFGVPSSSSAPSQTLKSVGEVQLGGQGGWEVDLSSCFACLSLTSEDFNSPKGTGDLKLGVSSDSKRKEVKKDNKNDNIQFGLSSALSHPAPFEPLQSGVSHLGQREKKKEGPKASSVGVSFGTGVINPTPAATCSVVSSEHKGSFNVGTTETNVASVAPFTCETSEAKKEERLVTKKQVTLGNMDPAPVPSASSSVCGITGKKHRDPVTPTSRKFQKKTDKEEPKSQPVTSLVNSKQRKRGSSSNSTRSFNVEKPSEQKSDEPTEAIFAVGSQTSATAGKY